MERAYGFFYRYITAFAKSGRLLAASLRFWPFPFWLRFWTCRDEEIKAPVGPFELYIRSRRLHLKMTDLYMAASCIVWEQYNPEPAFEIGPDDVVIDIGGHIGSFSVYAAKKAWRGHVYTFEPDEKSYGQLVKNVQANGLTNVSTFPRALGGHPGTRTLYSAQLNSAENNFYWGGARARDVDCGTLAEVFQKNNLERCDFLKVDCEGAEYEILLNTPPDVLRKIKRIGLEVHVGRYFGLTDPAAVPQTLTDFLERSGFSLQVWRENALHTFMWGRRP